MTGDDSAHWDKVYGDRETTALTWYQGSPALSLRLISEFAAPGAAVIDAGGGASRLVDALLAAGRAVSVLDLSGQALARSRARLGDAAARADWHMGDVTRWAPPRRYGLWHDRAVFHFLIDPAARAGYARTLLAALEPGGVAIIASFALDGPEKCSGLPVARYSPQTLAAELARLAPGQFTLIDSMDETHTTPMGREQRFQVSVFRRAG